LKIWSLIKRDTKQEEIKRGQKEGKETSSGVGIRDAKKKDVPTQS
jgi:hypothetical protein